MPLLWELHPRHADVALQHIVNCIVSSLQQRVLGGGADADLKDVLPYFRDSPRPARLYGVVLKVSLDKLQCRSGTKMFEDGNAFQLRFQVDHDKSGHLCDHFMERCVASMRETPFKPGGSDHNIREHHINDPCQRAVRVFCRPVDDRTGVPCLYSQRHIVRFKEKKSRVRQYGMREQCILFWCVHPFRVSILPGGGCGAEQMHRVELGAARSYGCLGNGMAEAQSYEGCAEGSADSDDYDDDDDEKRAAGDGEMGQDDVEEKEDDADERKSPAHATHPSSSPIGFVYGGDAGSASLMEDNPDLPALDSLPPLPGEHKERDNEGQHNRGELSTPCPPSNSHQDLEANHYVHWPASPYHIMPPSPASPPPFPQPPPQPAWGTTQMQRPPLPPSGHVEEARRAVDRAMEALKIALSELTLALSRDGR